LAAQTLQSRRFISYRRGRIEIVNRKGLKAAACLFALGFYRDEQGGRVA
jgi:hypothetical protein